MMRLSHYRKIGSLLQIKNRQFSVKIEIETKVISTEIIKPSSPTPKFLQKHQLSFLDRRAPQNFMPFVYFYSSNPKVSNSQKSDQLKKSLSETLSRFYPLAGRLVGNLYVDCNDSGAPFVEAEANCDLSLVIANPEPERIKKLLLYKTDESQDLCMAVQATYFRCGGLALALLISHKIADGLSLLTFTNAWSAAARKGGGGGGDMVSPKFDAASYFPPHDIPGNPDVVFNQEDVATRILKFPAARIAALQDRYSSVTGGGGGDLPRRRPSRVTALSTYIWTRFIFATGRQADPTKIYSILTAVNIRSLVDPPMSEYHFGNTILMSIAKPTAGDGGAEIAQKLWEAKKAVYDNVVCAEVKATEAMNAVMYEGERVVSFVFTSLCGFRLYEADFGWGKPVWVVVAGFPKKNVAVFSDTKSGDGIEVVLHLSKQDMEKFEANLELNY